VGADANREREQFTKGHERRENIKARKFRLAITERLYARWVEWREYRKRRRFTRRREENALDAGTTKKKRGKGDSIKIYNTRSKIGKE